MKKLLKISVTIVTLLSVAFVSFVLYETKDEINADLNNIDEKMKSFYNEKKMGGFAVSVFNDQEIIYSQGFGYNDLKNKTPYTTKTEQYLASVSKTTIGIALLKAEELGLLNIDDPINQHLPFKVFNPNFPEEEITIKQLATHTSSLDYNEPVVESLYIEENKKQKSLKTFMADYFQNGTYGEVTFTKHQPGSDWNYSNIGASLAAYIIEYKSAMNFADFTLKYIFEPLEIYNTHWFESVADPSNYTKYYESESSIKEVMTSGVSLYPARDMISNLEDLTIYCQAIISRDPKLLSAASFNKMLSAQLTSSISNTSVDNNGIFWMIDRNQYGVTYSLTGMNGGDNCINTMMWFDPKTKLGYIFIGNTGGSASNKGNHIRIFRALASLGDHYLMNHPEKNLLDRIAYKSHNVLSRIGGLF